MVWSGGFRSSFQLVPSGKLNDRTVDVFLAGNGRSEEEILAALPYDEARGLQGARPNRKRYRDSRQLLRSIGLVYGEKLQGRSILRVTALGDAVRRWRPVVTEANTRTLAEHAVRSLAAYQLRNPTREGKKYPTDVHVFPYSFIWRAMLALDGRIAPEELNRAIYRTRNEDDLATAIESIRQYREDGDPHGMGPEVITGPRRNDRILVWMGWASFGWTIIRSLRNSPGGTHYTIAPWARRPISQAAFARHSNETFATEASYIEYISDCAGLPKDLRD